MKRRQNLRVHAHGSVSVRDGGHELHGRLLMLGARELEVRCDLDVDPRSLVGRAVELSVWWEQEGQSYTVRGQVRYARSEAHSLVIAVEEPPPDLLAAIERALAACGEGGALGVLVIDSQAERRQKLAQALRDQGCDVLEAGSRVEVFEVLDALAQSGAPPVDAILVAPTTPVDVGEDLRSYLTLAHPTSIVLPLLGEPEPAGVLASVRELVAGVGL